MVDETLRTSLFGPSPEEVALARRAQDREYSMQKAQVPRGRMGVVAMGNAGAALGRVVGNALGGRDPAQDKAAAMQEAKQEVMQSGISLMDNPQEYYKAAFVALSRRGLLDEAAKVRAMMMQENAAAAQGRMDERGMRVKETEAGASALNARVNEYKALNPQMDSGSLSEIQKLTAQLEDPTLTPATRTAIEDRIAKLTHIPEPATTSIENKLDIGAGKARSEFALEEMKSIRDKGNNADLLLRQTEALKSQLESGNFDPGFVSGFRGSLASAAQYLGLASEDQLNAFRANPNDAGLLNSFTKNIVNTHALAMQASGNTQLSKVEMELNKESATNMTQTAQGMYVLNEFIRSLASYDSRLRDAAIEAYANLPDDGNDMQAVRAINQWKKDNPLSLDKKVLDAWKRHAQIIERGKTAPDFLATPKDARKEGRLYRNHPEYGLIIFRGYNPKTGKIIVERPQ